MNKYDDLCSSKYCDGLAIEKVQRPFFGYNPANIKFCAFRKFTFFFFPSVSSVISQTLDGKNVKNTRKTCKNIQSYKILFTRKWSRGVIHHIRITHTAWCTYYTLLFASTTNKSVVVVVLVQRLGKWRPSCLIHFARNRNLLEVHFKKNSHWTLCV
jgi:uncharacterized membrane protein YbjE (DUF340 family)